MSLFIEDTLLKDLDRLYAIETECFKEEAFSKSQIAQLLKDYNSVSLCARVDGQIVGFVIGLVFADREALNGHIFTIEVLSNFRRRGIGEKLLSEIEQLFRQKGAVASSLEVREDNFPAISLYRKLGYETVGKLKNYYRNAHGLFFRKSLR